MRKKTYFALAMAAILAFTPIMSHIVIASESEDKAAAQSEEEIATGSAGDEGQDDTGGDSGSGDQPETQEKTPLSVPTGLAWGDDWTLQWDSVEEAEGWYGYEVYRDGKEYVDEDGIYSFHGYGQFEDVIDGQKVIGLSMSDYIYESGTYEFRVMSAADHWDEISDIYADSEWSGFVAKEYIRPGKVLDPVTTVYWDDAVAGDFYFRGVEGAYGYRCYIYLTPASSNNSVNWENYTPGESEGEVFIGEIGGPIEGGGLDTANSIQYGGNISLLFDLYGAGKYRIKVISLSGNIDEIANNRMGTFSPYYDLSQTIESAKDVLGDALSAAESDSTSYAETRETVKENIDMSVLHSAMQTDNSVLEQIRQLESGYIAEQGITVSAPSVSKEASAYVNASKISVVGAGLNAVANSSVTLEVSVPDAYEKIPGQSYANAVQLDISLNVDGKSVHQLVIPITVTIPVPTGIDLSRLVVLHYFEDGTYETVLLKNNGDGTVTFTVDKFSTFVFAETVQEDTENSKDTENSNDTGNSNVYSSLNSRTALREQIVNVDWAAVANTITEAQKAGQQNAYVLAGTKYTVPVSVIRMLAKKDTALMLESGSALALSISGRDVRKASSKLKIEFSFDDVIPAAVSSRVTAGSILSRAFSMTSKKSLPFKVDVHLNLGYENAGKYAILYYYDEVSGTMRYSGRFQIIDSGQAMFAVTRGDEYIVVVTEKIPENLTSGNYTVVSGDTLSAIARRNGVRLQDVIKMNPQIKNPNRIYPGQNIIIP